MALERKGGMEGYTHCVAGHGRVDLASMRGPVGHGCVQVALEGQDLRQILNMHV